MDDKQQGLIHVYDLCGTSIVGKCTEEIAHKERLVHKGLRVIILNPRGEVFFRSPVDGYACPSMRGMAVRGHAYVGESNEEAIRRLLLPMRVDVRPTEVCPHFTGLDPGEQREEPAIYANVTGIMPCVGGGFVPIGRLEKELSIDGKTPVLLSMFLHKYVPKLQEIVGQYK